VNLFPGESRRSSSPEVSQERNPYEVLNRLGKRRTDDFASFAKSIRPSWPRAAATVDRYCSPVRRMLGTRNV